MNKRYQVFVSSTYADLEEERQEVMHALLELDCIPSGMELFPAANESQWSLIKRVIDDCDYYLLIIGGRYGSIGPEGISYTEMEYRHAVSVGKPILAFLHKDPGQILAARTEQSPEGKEKLTAFRETIQKKLCKYWSSPAELGSVVSRSLIQLIKTTPAIGWVRADEMPDKDATVELLRLRKLVDELTLELQKSRTSAPKGTETLAQGDDLMTFDVSFHSWDADAKGPFVYKMKVPASWNSIFASLAPSMLSEERENILNSKLASFVESVARTLLAKNNELQISRPHNFSIQQTDFETVKIQLRALGLIVRSERSRSVKDTSTYWCLTPYGDELMTRLRAIKREPQTMTEDNSSAS